MKVNALQNDAFQKLLQPEVNGKKGKDGPSFSETLGGMVDQVDALQKKSKQATVDFIAGKDIELHEVMAAGEEAQISFQFLMEVRNKLLEAYQEVSRMQI